MIRRVHYATRLWDSTNHNSGTVLLSVHIHDISVTSVLLSFKDLKLVVSFVAFIFLMNLVTSTLRHAVYLTILTFQNQNADCR